MSFRSLFLLCLLFCLVISTTKAQSTFPYTIKSDREAALLGAGILMGGATIYIGSKIQPLTIDQIDQLNINQIPKFDRYSTRFYSHTAHQVSNYSGLASIAFPAVVLWKKRNDRESRKLFLVGLEGALLTAGITNLTKMFIKRPRPFVFNDLAPMSEKMKVKSRYSFFSGHTSMSAYFTFSGAQMYSDLYPNSNKKALVWTTAAILPAITAYGRMRAGKHFPTDVIVGYGVGALLGVLVPRFHR